MTDPWAPLRRELDSWQVAGRVARFWWRDDDAAAATAALDRLLASRAGCAAPLVLAVSPGLAEEGLAARLAGEQSGAVILAQHGYRHVSHALPGEKNSEFGPNRPLAEALDDIAAGRDRLRGLFGEASRVFVPPWNRIAPAVAEALPGLGFDILSVDGDQRPGGTAIRHLNTCVDIIDWRGSRGFVGDDQANDATAEALRRTRESGNEGAVGILSHHLVHDAGAWAFLETLGAAVAGHPAARWIDPRDAAA